MNVVQVSSTWGARLLNLLTTKRISTNRADVLPSSLTKIYIDETTALKLSSVWACVRVISETIGALPWHVLRRDGEKRVPYITHPAHWLLSVQANPETTAMSWREVVLASALMYGDGYSLIERDTSGRPLWLWQIEPWRVRPDRDEGGSLIYRVRNDAAAADATVQPANMFHLHGLSLNGLTGLSLVRFASESIALGIAMEQFAAAFFGNSANPSGVFETDTALGPKQAQEFKEQYVESQKGVRSSGKSMVLPKGMKWRQVTVDPEKSQLTEARSAQIEEIARRFRVPPHKIGHLKHATFSNIEHQSIEFVSDCLLPWAIRLEQEANIKLFGRAQSGIAYTKLNLSALLRGDSKAQADAFAVGRQWGWLSANDVLRFLDMDPIGPQGDVYMIPANMMNAERAINASVEPEREEPSTPSTDELTRTPADRAQLRGRLLKLIEGQRHA